MKKQSRSLSILLFLVVVVIAGGIFWAYRHFSKNSDSERELSAAARVTAVGMQTVSGEGYSLSVPSSWYIEQSGKNVVAAYPDRTLAAASSTVPGAAACKIEMSVFPYAPSTSVADWISGRIGADSSLAIIEQSSEDLAVSGGTGVKWNGLIDGAPTTLVYAFSKNHAYEIAPSVINEKTAGNALCASALETFLSQLTIQ